MSEITKALVKFQKTAPIVVKNKHVSAGSRQYRYADLAEVISTIRDSLAEAGLAFSQSIESNGTTVLVTTLYHGESGDSMESRMPLPIENLQPQGVGSLLSYYRRYSLTALLGVVIDDEDDDAQGAQDAGVTHRKSSVLTQQLKASIAIESDAEQKNGRHLVPDPYANDKAFAPFIKEIGGRKYWKTTVITGTNENPGLMRQFLHDLEGITDIDELDGLEYDNRTLLQVCQIACPMWWEGKTGSDIPGVRTRIEKKRIELTRIAKDDPARYLQA